MRTDTDGRRRVGPATTLITAVLILTAIVLTARGSGDVGVSEVVLMTLVAVLAVLAAVRTVRSGRAAADLRAGARAVAGAAVVAVPFAAAAVSLGIVAVLVAVAPRSGLLGEPVALARSGMVWFPFWVIVCAGVYSFRRPTGAAVDIWLRTTGAPPALAGTAARHLRRMRTWRMVPAALGFAIGGAPGICLDVAVNLRPIGDPAVRALQGAAANGYLTVQLALVGYGIGVLAAEITRHPPVVGAEGGAALLDARQPSGYLTEIAHHLPAVLAAWVVTADAINALLGRPHGWARPLFAVAVAVGVAGAQRWIVQRPQRVARADVVALDDVLRSSAAHALSGTASAGLLALALAATQLALTVDGRTPGIASAALALIGVVGTYGLWANYGSAHRGRRPRRAGTAQTS